MTSEDDLISSKLDAGDANFGQDWAALEVLWEKVPKAMRAMRGVFTLENIPFRPDIGCTESSLKVLSSQRFQAARAMRNRA